MRAVVSSLAVNRQGREAGHSPSSARYESGKIHSTRPHIICLNGGDKDSFIIIIIIIIIITIIIPTTTTAAAADLAI
jgi:hypothetical protein